MKANPPLPRTAVAAIVLAIACGVLFTGTAASAQQGDEITPGSISAFADEFFARSMRRYRVPGAAFVFVADAKVAVAKGYGVADLRSREPVDPRTTVFPARSISKTVTATAVMQLVERGELELDADVNRYIESFHVAEAFGRPVTVARLLTHTAGLSTTGIGTLERSEADIRPLASYLASDLPPRTRAPGEVTLYGDHAHTLLALIVQEVSEIPFDRYVQENVLSPLEMEQTSFWHADLADATIASGYFPEGLNEPAPPGYFNTWPAAGLLATPLDMASFMLAHLSPESTRQAAPERSALEQMHEARFANDGRLPGVTYGFFEHLENDRRAIVSTGLGLGFASVMFLLPEEGMGFYAVYNKGQPHTRDDLVAEFLDRYFPAAAPERQEQVAGGRPGVEAYAGAYALPVNEDNFGRVVQAFEQTRVSVKGRDTISLSDGSEWRQVVEGLFERKDDPDEHIAFGTEDGRAQYLFPEHDFVGEPTVTLERLPWLRTTAGFLATWGGFVLVFGSAAVVWLRKRARGSTEHDPQGGTLSLGRAAVAAGTAGLVNLAFLIAFPVAAAVLGAGVNFDYGIPLPISALLSLPLLNAVVTAPLLVVAFSAWRGRWWSAPLRAHYSIVALAALVFVAYSSYWRVLGAWGW